jgi:hypothetical protein
MSAVQLRTNDRDAGLDTPDGRSFKPDANGIITLPERDAAYGRLAGRTGLFELRVPGWAGFDARDLAARYAVWEERREEVHRARRNLAAGPE